MRKSRKSNENNYPFYQYLLISNLGYFASSYLGRNLAKPYDKNLWGYVNKSRVW